MRESSPRWMSLGIILIPSTFVISSAKASLCDIVIAQRAFVQTDSRSVSDIYNRTRHDMCSIRWSDQRSFKSAANSLGISFEYGESTFGLNRGNSSSDSAYQAAYDKYCSMTDEEYKAYSASQASTVDPGLAVAAWEKCVLSQSYGLFASVTEAPNFNYFDVRLIHRTGGGAYEMTSLNVSDTVKCRAGDTAINPSTRSPFKIATAEYTFRCDKPADKPTSISFNTSDGSPLTIQVSGTELSQADLRNLQSDVQQLKNQSARDRQDITNLTNQVNGMNALSRIEFFQQKGILQRQAPPTSNWYATCPAGSQIVSGICRVESGNNGPNVNIQNFGISGNGWECVWRDRVENATVQATCARPKP